MEISCQRFGQDLLNILSNNNIDSNVIYSPLSIYMALGMTLSGAQSETLTQMMSTLYWDCANAQSFHNQLSNCMKDLNVDCGDKGAIKIANKLFLENKFNLLESFVTAMSTLYNGSIDKMDFQGQPEKSRQDINGWVEKVTNGKIANLLAKGNIHGQTKLILVNAIYFKGSWRNKFTLIGDKEFHLLNGETKPVKMISKTSQYKYLKQDASKFSSVQVPFTNIQNNEEYALVIILPHDNNGLENVKKSIFQQQWNTVLRDDLFEYTSVNVIMPKFRIECSFQLKEQLDKLGMKHAFSEQADFSAMTGNRDLMIDEVVHKAFIDVDENGVEAAAATAVLMMKRCMMREPQNPVEFTCDHPFMFALVKSGSLPLFVGHLAQL